MTSVVRLVGVGFTGAMLSLALRRQRPEMALVITLVTSIIIALEVVLGIGEAVAEIGELVEESGVTIKYFPVAIKAMGIAYITQFAGELLRDANETAIASKLEMAGRIAILLMTIPVISAFLEMCIEVLRGI